MPVSHLGHRFPRTLLTWERSIACMLDRIFQVSCLWIRLWVVILIEPCRRDVSQLLYITTRAVVHTYNYSYLLLRDGIQELVASSHTCTCVIAERKSNYSIRQDTPASSTPHLPICRPSKAHCMFTHWTFVVSMMAKVVHHQTVLKIYLRPLITYHHKLWTKERPHVGGFSNTQNLFHGRNQKL